MFKKAISLLLFFSVTTFVRAKDHVELELKTLKEDKTFYFIASITAVRARLTVSSDGYFFLKRCFKEHRFNLPFTPKTVSYKLEKNLTVKHQKKSIKLKGLMPIYAWAKLQMDQYLDPLCSEKATVLVMATGRLQNGDQFKAHFDIQFDELGNLIFKSKAQRVTISHRYKKAVSVSKSYYAEATWEKIWEELNPEDLAQKTNY